MSFLDCPNEIKNHPLVGKQLIDLRNNKIYDIEKVCKQMYNGSYITLLASRDGNNGKTHTQIMFKNIDCKEEFIIEMIEKNKNIIKIIN